MAELVANCLRCSARSITVNAPAFGIVTASERGCFMKKLVVMMAVVSTIATIIDVSDASAQSWGRRGANVRCTNGGVVQERWYCNLKNAPAGPWNNYRSRGRYKLRPGMEGR